MSGRPRSLVRSKRRLETLGSDYNDARTFVSVKLNRLIGNPPRVLERHEIEQVVHDTLEFLELQEVNAGRLVAELESSFATWIGAERLLSSDEDGYEPWLQSRKAEIKWAYWRRYEQFLLEQGWAKRTLLKLDETTDRVLGLLTAPDRTSPWDRRGMVVGHVQAGKTSHYIGLIAKAVDAGYKLIIVLAGFHKSLRSQTQIRLEEGFVGYDRTDLAPGGGRRITGVGRIDPTILPDTLTTRADGGDFKRQLANQLGIVPGGKPLLLVIKKNGPVLKNLLVWLRSVANGTDEHGSRYLKDICPMLVVDDECDQGSIDTKDGAFDEDGNVDEEHDPTTLNRRIRELLKLSNRSAYVGYTATPFANIFIHEGSRARDIGEDLFPRSFILSLPTPSNYVGATEIFGGEDANGNTTPGLPITRHVTDHAASLGLREREGWMPPLHNKEHAPRFASARDLPPSLRGAVRCFILSTAARKARRHETAHNSMLVHVTRFTAVQEQVVEQLKEEMAEVRRCMRYDSDTIRDEFRTLWETDYAVTTAAIDETDCTTIEWSEIDARLDAVIESIEVRTIHGLSGEVLDYVSHREHGLNVIAVGGDKLSRGLTLEGLTVSYFLRASRMYDTLMQMGRWFGYRPGYLDLCRLFSTPDLIDWLSHIAVASDELRDDFNRMAISGATPKEFGHRVRCHPLLLVTSRVKMRHGQNIRVTFAGDISETINFRRDLRAIEKNWGAGQKLIEQLDRLNRISKVGTSSNARVWDRVAAEVVLEFLGSYVGHEASQKCIPVLLAEYIRAEVGSGRLVEWTIQLCSGNVPGEKAKLGKEEVPRVERNYYLGRDVTQLNEVENARRALKGENHYRIRRLVSPKDEEAGLSELQVQEATQMTVRDWERDPRGRERPNRPSGLSLRKVRSATEGLLLLYPIDGTGKVEVEAERTPVLGFAISFPQVDSEQASTVSYQVNNIYYKQEHGRTS